ncbi:hypothetical protein BH10PLA2_BH10PLA2_08460 [soil metagenome]
MLASPPRWGLGVWRAVKPRAQPPWATIVRPVGAEAKGRLNLSHAMMDRPYLYARALRVSLGCRPDFHAETRQR